MPDTNNLQALYTDLPGPADAGDAGHLPGMRLPAGPLPSTGDYHEELRELGARVFGLSTQGTTYQREAAERLRLTFDLLGDEDLILVKEAGLPTLEGDVLTRRVTMIREDGRVENVFYPIFPPDENAERVVQWLSARGTDVEE